MGHLAPGHAESDVGRTEWVARSWSGAPSDRENPKQLKKKRKIERKYLNVSCGKDLCLGSNLGCDIKKRNMKMSKVLSIILLICMGCKSIDPKSIMIKSHSNIFNINGF